MIEQLRLFEEKTQELPSLREQREYPLPEERPLSGAAIDQGWHRGRSVRAQVPVEVSLAQESSDKQWHPPTAEERSLAKQKIAEARCILARS